MKPVIFKASASLSEQLYFLTRTREVLRLQTARPKHHWYCPKCLVEMASVQRGDVMIETCPQCCGIFLDDGELEAIKP